MNENIFADNKVIRKYIDKSQQALLILHYAFRQQHNSDSPEKSYENVLLKCFINYFEAIVDKPLNEFINIVNAFGEIIICDYSSTVLQLIREKNPKIITTSTISVHYMITKALTIFLQLDKKIEFTTLEFIKLFSNMDLYKNCEQNVYASYQYCYDLMEIAVKSCQSIDDRCTLFKQLLKHLK